MKNIFLLGMIGLLTACGASIPDYQNMSEAQQEKFMAGYQKDMIKIYSRANAMGKMQTVIEADAETDTITHLMIMDMDMKGAGGNAMAKQVSDMMLEQNCQEGFMRDFVEAGISFRMQMKDARGKMIVNTEVTPKRCAKFLKAG